MLKSKFTVQSESDSDNLQIIDLPNHIKLIYDYVPSLKSFSLGISVMVGSREDPLEKPGIAHFLEHQLFRRNLHRTSTQTSKEFERTGTINNAFTESEYTVYFIKSLNNNFKKVFQLLADFFLCPVFDERDFKKEQKIILEEIKSYQDDPEENIFDLGNSLAFSHHTLGNPIAGTVKSVSHFKQNDIYDFFKRYYSSDNIVISYSGSHPIEFVRNFAFELFKDFSNHTPTQVRTPLPNNTIDKLIINRKIEQSHILLLKRFDNIDSDFVLKLKLLNYILGEGPSSFINQNIREKQAISYSAFSLVEHFTDTNLIEIYFATDKKAISKTKDLLNEIFEKITNKKISKQLFAISKNALLAQNIYKSESSYERMLNNIRLYQLDGNFEFDRDFQKNLNAIDYAEFLDWASNIFADNKFSEVQILQNRI
jgi:predicted Zn-dependent peptidase